MKGRGVYIKSLENAVTFSISAPVMTDMLKLGEGMASQYMGLSSKALPEEDEPWEKNARLAELDAKLNFVRELDTAQGKEQECGVSDASDNQRQTKPSVLAG